MTVHVPIKRKHPDERKQDLEIQDEINIENYYYYYEIYIIIMKWQYILKKLNELYFISVFYIKKMISLSFYLRFMEMVT